MKLYIVYLRGKKINGAFFENKNFFRNFWDLISVQFQPPSSCAPKDTFLEMEYFTLTNDFRFWNTYISLQNLFCYADKPLSKEAITEPKCIHFHYLFNRYLFFYWIEKKIKIFKSLIRKNNYSIYIFYTSAHFPCIKFKRLLYP